MTDTSQTADVASTQGPAKTAATKKSAAKRAAAGKSTAKKTTSTSATKKTAAKRTAARKATAKKATAKKSVKKTATKRPPATKATARDTAPSRVLATGRAVVARAATATQKPVEAGRVLVEKAGERVAEVGRAVLTPSTQFFARAPVRAQAIAADPEALRGLADKVLHSESGRTGPVGEVVDDLRTLGRLVAAYGRGEYRDIPLDSLVMVIAGLVYVVSPLDLIPDAVPVAGYADDVVAVGFVIRQVHHELAAFREWEERSTS